jgi:hypothetical protein
MEATATLLLCVVGRIFMVAVRWEVEHHWLSGGLTEIKNKKFIFYFV